MYRQHGMIGSTCSASPQHQPDLWHSLAELLIPRQGGKSTKRVGRETFGTCR